MGSKVLGFYCGLASTEFMLHQDLIHIDEIQDRLRVMDYIQCDGLSGETVGSYSVCVCVHEDESGKQDCNIILKAR